MNPSKLLDWRGQTCVVAASGPSLRSNMLSLLDDVRIITTNTSWELFPSVDVVYACDMLWWKLNHQKVRAAGLHDRCWTQDRASAERWQLNWIRQAARPGLGTKELHVNGNSGFGAINLAYLFGARRILLLGFDMREVKGKKHWHPDHPKPCVQNMPFKEWLFKSVALARDLEKEGCEVINCCLDSALTVFKKMPLEEALRGSQTPPISA
jgi:hypothetical protein